MTNPHEQLTQNRTSFSSMSPLASHLSDEFNMQSAHQTEIWECFKPLGYQWAQTAGHLWYKPTILGVDNLDHAQISLHLWLLDLPKRDQRVTERLEAQHADHRVVNTDPLFRDTAFMMRLCFCSQERYWIDLNCLPVCSSHRHHFAWRDTRSLLRQFVDLENICLLLRVGAQSQQAVQKETAKPRIPILQLSSTFLSSSSATQNRTQNSGRSWTVHTLPHVAISLLPSKQATPSSQV